MNRAVMTAAAMLIGAACAPSRPPAANAEAVKQVIAEYYDMFFRSLDKEKYRSLLTDDYRLLENGQILDIEGDIAEMPHPDSGYRRSDVFDFRSVQVHDDTAYAVYFLRVALLHSTRIVKPAD